MCTSKRKLLKQDHFVEFQCYLFLDFTYWFSREPLDKPLPEIFAHKYFNEKTYAGFSSERQRNKNTSKAQKTKKSLSAFMEKLHRTLRLSCREKTIHSPSSPQGEHAMMN
jgi:hypothetical protein